MLEDAPQISAYLNQRLTLFVQQPEEAQLLTGSGTAPNLRGLIGTTRTSGPTPGARDDNATALFKAMNRTRDSSQLDMDTIVINPTNWQAIRLAKDSSGQYFGGGPFHGAYGGPAGPATASQFATDSVWGVKVIVTSAITVGTALVGAFATGGAIHRRGGLTVEATNQPRRVFRAKHHRNQGRDARGTLHLQAIGILCCDRTVELIKLSQERGRQAGGGLVYWFGRHRPSHLPASDSQASPCENGPSRRRVHPLAAGPRPNERSHQWNVNR